MFSLSPTPQNHYNMHWFALAPQFNIVIYLCLRIFVFLLQVPSQSGGNVEGLVALAPQFNTIFVFMYLCICMCASVFVFLSICICVYECVFVYLCCKFPVKVEGMLEVWFALAPQFNIVARQHG